MLVGAANEWSINHFFRLDTINSNSSAWTSDTKKETHTTSNNPVVFRGAGAFIKGYVHL